MPMSNGKCTSTLARYLPIHSTPTLMWITMSFCPLFSTMKTNHLRWTIWLKYFEIAPIDSKHFGYTQWIWMPNQIKPWVTQSRWWLCLSTICHQISVSDQQQTQRWFCNYWLHSICAFWKYSYFPRTSNNLSHLSNSRWYFVRFDYVWFAKSWLACDIIGTELLVV